VQVKKLNKLAYVLDPSQTFLDARRCRDWQNKVLSEVISSFAASQTYFSKSI